MKYAVITLPPLLVFAAVLVAGDWLIAEAVGVSPVPAPASPLRLRDALAAPAPEAAPPPAAAPEEEETVIATPPRPPPPPDPRVPPQYAAALAAVAADVNLCVSQRLERDLGPIDIDVQFTPQPGGGFAPGTRVSTSWGDPSVAECIAEVFDEARFQPSQATRFEPAEFVFHLPEDAMTGLLGLSYEPFH